ncbi:G- coupled receptor 54-like [Paramuricea clavata]|uniref:G- coupled receptor 54-like n=1 Tax=Paramuricea clavata TaxID=317549 RepID=A0A6S7HW46_PARCT|nr:G- coupled receptor 54-like [Paramuricea clavata]
MSSWITGFTAEVLVTILTEGVYDPATESCKHIVVQNTISTICLSTGLFLLQSVITLTLFTLAYIDVFRGIKASLRFAVSARAEHVNGIKRLKKVTKVTKVAAITTFVLAVCWLPCSVSFYYSLLVYEPFNDLHNLFVVYIGLLAFANSCINPFVYVFSNPELRNALRDIFC